MRLQERMGSLMLAGEECIAQREHTGTRRPTACGASSMKAGRIRDSTSLYLSSGFRYSRERISGLGQRGLALRGSNCTGYLVIPHQHVQAYKSMTHFQIARSMICGSATGSCEASTFYLLMLCFSLRICDGFDFLSDIPLLCCSRQTLSKAGAWLF